MCIHSHTLAHTHTVTRGADTSVKGAQKDKHARSLPFSGRLCMLRRWPLPLPLPLPRSSSSSSPRLSSSSKSSCDGCDAAPRGRCQLNHPHPRLTGCRAGACRRGGCEEGSSGAAPWWATGDWLQTGSRPTGLRSRGTCRSSAGGESIESYIVVGFKLELLCNILINILALRALFCHCIYLKNNLKQKYGISRLQR